MHLAEMAVFGQLLGIGRSKMVSLGKIRASFLLMGLDLVVLGALLNRYCQMIGCCIS